MSIYSDNNFNFSHIESKIPKSLVVHKKITTVGYFFSNKQIHCFQEGNYKKKKKLFMSKLINKEKSRYNSISFKTTIVLLNEFWIDYLNILVH